MRLLGLLLILFSIQSQAQDVLKTLAEKNPTLSPWELIEKLYNDSSPAKWDNFGKNSDTAAAYNCAGVRESTPNEVKDNKFIPTHVKVMTDPGEASRGPLFPGRPPTFNEAVIGLDIFPYELTEADTKELNSQEIKMAVDQNQFVANFENDNMSGSISYRFKDGLLSHFEVFNDKKDPSNSYKYYQYCWKK